MLDKEQDKRIYKHFLFRFISKREFEPVLMATALFLLSLLVYILIIPKIMHSWNPTGDEPHYLVIIKSLVNDHDLDLRNNYDKGPEILHVVVRPDGTWRPAHDIGLPIVMYIPFILGDEFGIYVMLAIIMALIGSSVFLLSLELTKNLTISIFAWFFTAFLPPTFLYAFQLYPETLGALILVWCIRLLIRDRLTSLQWILISIWAGCFPWLVGRFAPLSVLITMVGIYSIYRQDRKYRQRALIHLVCLLVPEIILAVIYMFYLNQYYGSISPMVFHPSAGSVLPSPGIIGFLRLSIGWLIDQRMGLFIISPVIMLSIIGMILFLKRKEFIYTIIIIIILLYFLLITIFSGDFWVQTNIPVRYLIVIVPLLMLLSAYSLININKFIIRFISIILVIFGLLNSILVIGDENLALSTFFSKSPLVTKYSKMIGIDLTRFIPIIEDQAPPLKFNSHISDNSASQIFTSGLFFPGFDIIQGYVITDPNATFSRAAYVNADISVGDPWLTGATIVKMPKGIVLIKIRAKYLESSSQTDINAPAFTVIITASETSEEIQHKSFRIGDMGEPGYYKTLEFSAPNPKQQILRISINYDAPVPLVLDYVSYKSTVAWWSSWGLVIIWSIIIAMFVILALWRRSR